MKKGNVLLVIFFCFFTSCHKDATNRKECGCGSTVYQAVNNIKGTLSWAQHGGKKVWTLDGSGLLSPITMPYICTVCNSDAIDDLIDTDNSEQIPVIFSGDLYKVCDEGGMKPANATSHFFMNIELLKKNLP